LTARFERIMSEDRAPNSAVRVRALFFASYRDVMGAHQLELELGEGSTVADLVEAVRARRGGDQLPESPPVAVNQEYSAPDTVLRDGDEVAFIPPVAGG
jgi:molybdopterin converting factor subunit 1